MNWLKENWFMTVAVVLVAIIVFVYNYDPISRIKSNPEAAVAVATFVLAIITLLLVVATFYNVRLISKSREDTFLPLLTIEEEIPYGANSDNDNGNIVFWVKNTGKGPATFFKHNFIGIEHYSGGPTRGQVVLFPSFSPDTASPSEIKIPMSFETLKKLHPKTIELYFKDVFGRVIILKSPIFYREGKLYTKNHKSEMILP